MGPALLGLLWYFPAIVVLSFIALRIFDTDNRYHPRRFIENFSYMRGHAIMLFLILSAIKVADIINKTFSPGRDFTGTLYGIEGNAHIVWIQSSIQNSFFIHLASIFYVLVFIWMIMFTAFFLVATNRRNSFRILTYALVLNYCVMIPFYLFFNVTVASMYPPGTSVQPLLYSNDMYRGLVLMISGFHDCFPSGHISVSVIIVLLLFLKTSAKRFAYAALAMTILTAFVIIYLGIHWMLDIAAGIILGYAAFAGAQWTPLTRGLDSIAGKLKKILPRILY